MIRFDFLEARVRVFFYKYANFVARHPIPFVIVPLLLTGALAFGFLDQHEVTDAVYLFTPDDAPSKYERMVIHEKWPLYERNYIPGRAVTQTREIQVKLLFLAQSWRFSCSSLHGAIAYFR